MNGHLRFAAKVSQPPFPPMLKLYTLDEITVAVAIIYMQSEVPIIAPTTT